MISLLIGYFACQKFGRIDQKSGKSNQNPIESKNATNYVSKNEVENEYYGEEQTEKYEMYAEHDNESYSQA